MQGASYNRLARQAETARRLAAIPAYVPADEERLFKLANPENIEPQHFTLNGHRFGLAHCYQLRRRACVLRAWCAKRMGWPKVVRACLVEATRYRELARYEAKREIAKLFGRDESKVCYRCGGILPCRDCGAAT